MLRLLSVFSAVSYVAVSIDPDNSINGDAPPGGPPKVSFDQDLDPKTRSISGTITIQAPAGASTLQGYRLYPSADGSANIGGEPATHAINLPKSCPPDVWNDDYDNASADPANTWTPLAAAACENDSPYSPKCVGDSCGEIIIKPGSDGEYYISRYDNTADQTSPGSYENTYQDGESAMVYLPSRGILKIVSTDIDSSGADKLYLEEDKVHGTSRTDLGTANTWTSDSANDIELGLRESVVTWTTDNDGNLSTGWTLVFVPKYPTYPMTNQRMTDGSGGLRVVPVTGGSGTPTITTSTDTGTDDDSNASFAETYDWLVPNSTCTPTTMLCPLPDTWAHVDYSTPDDSVSPAEGSCTQVKSDGNTGDQVKFDECGQGTDRTAGATERSERLPPGERWAGNCYGVTSYFWFEKIACGSDRLFHTDRSLIEDKVVLSPSAQHLQDIKDLYYTTKAPETDYTSGGGIRWIDPDYHIKPLLPPKVECSCVASMDAYASLLSVVSKTPTPDAPETMDPEILNSGTSKIVATLRVYNDPTYSIPHDSSSEVPVVVERFYLEVSTKFTRNHITIRDCNAAHEEQYLNETESVTPLKTRINYCDQETYDTRNEGVPSGITHIDRISMKKFKFGATFDVFMQCKIRACQAKPCGTCEDGNLDDPPNPNVRRLQYNAAPMEGEMFAPPVSFKIGASDDTALVFDEPQRRAPTATPSSSEQTAPTSKPVQIHSDISLPLSPSWAIQNRESLTQTLRSTLSLRADEDLVITRISAARRLEKTRKLQEGGSVKIDFVVGLGRAERATQAQSSLVALSSGQPTALQTFTAQLDTQLQAAGQPAVALTPSAVSFGVPSQNSVAAVPASAPASWEWTPTVVAQQQPVYNNWSPQQQSPQQQQTSQQESDNNSLVLILAGSAAALMLLVFAYSKVHVVVQQVDGDQQLPPTTDSYQGKVAALDAQ